MATRSQRLLRRALRRTRLSPEEFAARYPAAVVHYSGRSIRRWLDAAEIPAFVAAALTAFLAHLGPE